MNKAKIPFYYFRLFFIGAVFLLWIPSFVKAAPLPYESGRGLQIVAAVEGYLNQLKTLKTHFVQINADGSVNNGIFYLKRPWRMRFEYAPPSPYLMLTSKNFFIHIDKELEEITHIPLSDSPMYFLLRPKVSLRDENIYIERMDLQDGILRISLRDRKEKAGAVVDLIFNASPLYLRQWMLTDSNKQTVRVNLIDPVVGISLSDKIFKFDPPWKNKFSDR